MGQPSNPSCENATDEAELSRKRYDIVLKHLAYENTAYWTRSQLFLVANAALIGFALKEIPTSLVGVSKTRLVTLLVCSVVGILLAVLWIYGLKAGQGWINHWVAALKSWEGSAFGDVNLLRSRPDGVPSATRIARMTSLLFAVLWSAVSVFLCICWYFKIRGWNLP
jgi:hypothetical protein